MLNKPKHLMRCAAVGMAVCAAASGTAAYASSGSSRAKTKKIDLSLGFIPIAGAAPVVIAEKDGYFAKQGIQVKNDNLATPAEGVANLVSGKDQIGFINPGSFVLAVQNHLPIQVVAPLYYSTTDQGIYAKAGGAYTNIASLSGQTVAVGSLNSSSEAAIMYQFSNAGVNPASVKFTLLPVADIASAVESGTVAAGQVVEPFITQAGNELTPVVKNIYKGLGSPAPQAYAITSTAFAKAHPTELAAFKTAFEAAEERAAHSPAAVRSAIASFTSIPAALLDKMTLPTFGTNMDIADVRNQLLLMANYKMISSVPNIAKLFPR